MYVYDLFRNEYFKNISNQLSLFINLIFLLYLIHIEIYFVMWTRGRLNAHFNSPRKKNNQNVIFLFYHVIL